MKWALAILCAVTGAANAQSIGSNFYCRDEFSGGLGFNERGKNWQGAVFSSRNNFVLHMEEVGTTASGKYAIEARRLAVTPEGDSQAVRCLDLTQDVADMERVQIQKDIVRCTASVTEYQFNLKNNRFLRVYAYGYVNGADTNDDTPYISGGRCTKIN
jgi:hypothetical protein